MNNNICFIILHYGENKKITLNAISAIRKLDFSGKKDIVVVCNGKEFDLSNDLDKDIHTLVLEENRGFSIGNNYGYLYAKQSDNYDFIIIINNDIVIEQNDFITKIYQLYSSNHFFIAGPDIYMPYIDYHSNPLRSSIPTIFDVEKRIELREYWEKELNKPFSLTGLKMYIKESFKYRDKLQFLYKISRKIKKNNKTYNRIQKNVVLQGSCYIFSRDFIDINDKAFEPEIFLYNEENYLAIRCKEHNWDTVYSNKIKVIHYHRGSSNLIGLSYREFCDRKIAINRIVIESAKGLMNYLEEKSLQ